MTLGPAVDASVSEVAFTWTPSGLPPMANTERLSRPTAPSTPASPLRDRRLRQPSCGQRLGRTIDVARRRCPSLHRRSRGHRPEHCDAGARAGTVRRRRLLRQCRHPACHGHIAIIGCAAERRAAIIGCDSGSLDRHGSDRDGAEAGIETRSGCSMLGAARAVWPTVDAKALGRAFDQLQQQTLEFDECAIAVTGARAVASCGGNARYVPKVGNKSPRTEARQWSSASARSMRNG